MEKVSICIPSYNQEKTIAETINSCLSQEYSIKEIIVCDDCSTDKTQGIAALFPYVRIFGSEKNQGIGKNIQRCIDKATGEYIVFLCGDDIFADDHVIGDIVDGFRCWPEVGYIGRWYYQFMNGYPGAVRIHRSSDPYFQADNPSGLAFRKEAIKDVKVSTEIFVEASSIVKQVLDKGWDYRILKYDTIAVRIHPGGNTATVKSYYRSSPTLSWLGVVGKHKLLLTAFISFIQLKNWATYPQLFREIWLFIKLRPVNLLRPDFWFYAMIAVFTPRKILRPFTNFYKHRISRYFVRIAERKI